MTSKINENQRLVKIQKRVLKLVAAEYPTVYLVGGTAISLIYKHRVSEDLDFFTHNYSRKLHAEIAKFIKRKTGYSYKLISESKGRRFVRMAIYEFEVGGGIVLKIDIVDDIVGQLNPTGKDGVASIDDIYYRKVLAVIGFAGVKSLVGRELAGGRQKAKDLFDIYFLSSHFKQLSVWFPEYFDKPDYKRLLAWYLHIPKQKTILELLDIVPGCDTKEVFRHLDREIIHKLNKRYVPL